MKICFVTGSRADYGLLKSLIEKFQNRKQFKTDIIVTGSHLSQKHGFTIKEIIKDKIKTIHKIDLNKKGDHPHDISSYIDKL